LRGCGINNVLSSFCICDTDLLKLTLINNVWLFTCGLCVSVLLLSRICLFHGHRHLCRQRKKTGSMINYTCSSKYSTLVATQRFPVAESSRSSPVDWGRRFIPRPSRGCLSRIVVWSSIPHSKNLTACLNTPWLCKNVQDCWVPKLESGGSVWNKNAPLRNNNRSCDLTPVSKWL
jgi:hypothetical protein